MPSMSKKTFFCYLFFLLLNFTTTNEDVFTFNGFSTANLHIDGMASIASNGLLELTNTTEDMKGHAFYPGPFHFKSVAGKTLSFSTTFVFAIRSEFTGLGGPGIAFCISPTTDFSSAFAGQYFGLFNTSNIGNSTNHIIAVEIDSVQNPEFQDINDNHIGININSMKSNKSYPAGFHEDRTGVFTNLSLKSGQPMQLWIDFDGELMQLNVTLSPLQMPKPKRPLLSSTLDLASMMMDSMYVGFSSAEGPIRTHHYILAWSFEMNRVAEPLNYRMLPSLPVINTKGNSGILVKWLPVALCFVVLLVVVVAGVILRRRTKYAELLEDWEIKYGPRRFSYKDLYQATKGFKERDLLGTGGFGRVYRGVLPSNMEVAVKKVSHDSRQGIKEFVAEVVSIGQLRHRNIVQLLGYCRRKGELLLVYDFMPNGSLDKFLYDNMKATLSWAQRFRIIKGVASGLLYLHEDWEQVIVHRDIKASNVLLDAELNARLGDFGLARLYDHGTVPQTTRVVGTMGYLAPELVLVGKATTLTDVFAFGAFMLEVVCGRRPIERHGESSDIVLVDWVLESWRRGSLLQALDPRLGEECCAYEVELVLKLGLLCSHPTPAARPSMRQVMQILDGDAELPELLASSLGFSSLSMCLAVGFDDYIVSFPSSAATLSSISGGR